MLYSSCSCGFKLCPVAFWVVLVTLVMSVSWSCSAVYVLCNV